MISIVQVAQAFPIGFFRERGQNLLPDAAALVFQQAPMTGFRGRRNVVRQIVPATAHPHHIQNAVDHFPINGTGPTRASRFGQEPFDPLPLGVG